MIAVTFFIACKNPQRTTEAVNKNNIPYTIADKYFVKNTVGEFNTSKIENQQKFDEFFGMATVMGEGGRPTIVDFNKQYVVAIVKPETNRSTKISPISLQTSEVGEVLFTYKVEVGEENTYTTRPLLLIIIDKNHNGNLVLNEIE